jgi:hypothetical protein
MPPIFECHGDCVPVSQHRTTGGTRRRITSAEEYHQILGARAAESPFQESGKLVIRKPDALR